MQLAEVDLLAAGWLKNEEKNYYYHVIYEKKKR